MATGMSPAASPVTLRRTLKRLLPRGLPLAPALARAAQCLILSRELQRQRQRGGDCVFALRVPSANRLRSAAAAGLECRMERGHVGHQEPGAPSRAVAAIAGVAGIGASLASVAGCEALRDCETAEESSELSCESHGASPGFEDAFELRSLLGAGAFGVVMLCRSKATGEDFAVKIVQDLPSHVAEVAREQNALARIEQHGGHANIVAYCRSYAEGGFHYLVMESLAGDSLFSFMKARHTLDVSSALQLVAQLADALVFMGDVGLIHRDLKPENIMVTVPGGAEQPPALAEAGPGDITLKIIDFGSAGHASSLEPAEAGRPAALSGTRTYWSPEALERQSMTAAMDAWALGCILFIMLSGRHPFDLMGCSSEQQILQRIADDQVSFLLPEWDGVPEDVKELVRGLLEKDPARRLTPQDILAHPAVRAALSGGKGSEK